MRIYALHGRRPRTRELAHCLALIACAGCQGASPALSVGAVSFQESELLGLSPARRLNLGLLTSFGLAVSEGGEVDVAKPLLDLRTRERIIQRLETELKLRAAGVTEEVLEARYLTAPRCELVVRHLVLLSDRSDPEARRAEARQAAERALQQALAGDSFPELAGRVSQEPGAAERGGLLQPGREGSWVPEFWQAANALDEGEISDVVETEYGYHVLKLEERRIVPFAEVRDEVAAEVALMLGHLGDQVQAWKDSATARVRLDPDGISAWMDGVDSGITVLATWEGIHYSSAEFRRHLLGREATVGARAREEERQEVERLVMEMIRGVVLEEVAWQMGVTLSAAEEEEIRRDWLDTTARWASALGFHGGQSSEEVKASALEGLSSTRQSAMIARDELLRWAPMLSAATPVHLGS
ncbi:MAG: peptidylprolyl isomerase [bacterium]|nr:MAG: peptidylprolyl isomerase [bacterium]